MSKSEPGDLPFMTLTVKSIPPAFVKKELKLPPVSNQDTRRVFFPGRQQKNFWP